MKIIFRDADGVHLGQGDGSIRAARGILGDDKIIGASNHSLSQALKSAKDGADYIAVGPIFATPSKAGKKPVGLTLLRKVVKKVDAPVVAIGGIDRTNLKTIKKTGCQRVAVIRAIVARKNISQAVGSMNLLIPRQTN